MASEKKKINPFHFLLALAGVVFTITAASYCLVIIRGNRGSQFTQPINSSAKQPDDQISLSSAKQVETGPPKLPPANPWFVLLRDHATEIFVWEVGAIAVFTVCAMGLDRYRDVKEEREKGTSQQLADNS